MQGVEDVRIIDNGSDFSGGWYWNRYLRLSYDTESYVYLPMLEEMGFASTEKYINGEKIRSYAQSIARRVEFFDCALSQTTVTEVVWEGALHR